MKGMVLKDGSCHINAAYHVYDNLHYKIKLLDTGLNSNNVKYIFDSYYQKLSFASQFTPGPPPLDDYKTLSISANFDKNNEKISDYLAPLIYIIKDDLDTFQLARAQDYKFTVHY